MKIANKHTALILAEFRAPGVCELCHVACLQREPHHLWTRTPEVSIRINLIATGHFYGIACQCHRLIHDGKIAKKGVLEVVAARERCIPEDITEVIEWMRRLVKPTELQLFMALSELSTSARKLAERELLECQLLPKVTE